MATKKDLHRTDVLLLLRLQFFFQKSLKEEQRECIQRMVCLEEEVIVVLPMGFGNKVDPEHYRII